MENYTEEQIKNIIQSYHQKREREREQYERVKDTEQFKIENRQRVKEWYEKNKDKRKQEYLNNKDIKLARSSYYYYKRIDKLDVFKEKFPEKHKLLVDNHYINN